MCIIGAEKGLELLAWSGGQQGSRNKGNLQKKSTCYFYIVHCIHTSHNATSFPMPMWLLPCPFLVVWYETSTEALRTVIHRALLKETDTRLSKDARWTTGRHSLHRCSTNQRHFTDMQGGVSRKHNSDPISKTGVLILSFAEGQTALISTSNRIYIKPCKMREHTFLSMRLQEIIMQTIHRKWCSFRWLTKFAILL